MRTWTLDDIPWTAFDPGRIDPEVVPVIKAASLVERNAADYVAYLRNVFADDDAFRASADQWGREEEQHGDALGQWAERADPGFDYAASFQRFRDGYRIPVDSTRSVRGSRSAELVARCVVETGTSSFYSALRDASEEPVLKWICHRIAGDEFRHYKLFYTYLQRYQDREPLSRLRRALVVIGRYREIEDDELAYAYYAANLASREPRYDRKRANNAYVRGAFPRYQQEHVNRAVQMMMKPIGIAPGNRLGSLAARAIWHVMQRHARRAQAA